PRQRCYQIESICIDAVDFLLPPVPSVLFFYSPFTASLLTKVMDNVRKSLAEHPRSLYILYVGVIPESIEVLKNSNLTSREIALRRDYTRWVTKRGFILHSGTSEKRGRVAQPGNTYGAHQQRG